MIAEAYDFETRATTWGIEPKWFIFQAAAILIVIGLFFIIRKKKKSNRR
jgi:hypothetical protein